MKPFVRTLFILIICSAVPAGAKKAQPKSPPVNADAGTASEARSTQNAEALPPPPGKVPTGTADSGGDVAFGDLPTDGRATVPQGSAGSGAVKGLPPKPMSAAPTDSSANDPGKPADGPGMPTAVWAVIVLLAAALGAAAGWLARGKQVPPIRTSSTREDRSATASSSTPRLSPAAVGGPAGLAGATAGPLAPSGRNPLPPRPAPSDSPMGGQPAQPFAPNFNVHAAVLCWHKQYTTIAK